MDESPANTAPTLAVVDEALASGKLRPAPKALLLLRVCQFAQYLQPALIERYWPQLQEEAGQLQPAHKPAYEQLKTGLESKGGGPKKKRGKAVQGVLDTIEAASACSAEKPDEAKQMLEDAYNRLRGISWWHRGRADAWSALAFTWAGVERVRALGLIGEIPARIRRTLIVQLNDKQPLSAGEWSDVDTADGERTIEAVTDILEREEPQLTLCDAVAQAVAGRLLPKVHAKAITAETERQTEAEREKSLVLYKNLARCVAKSAPATAGTLMERLFSATATANLYAESWLEQFTALSNLLTFWAGLADSREKTRDFLRSSCPKHLRDFALGQWTAMFPSNLEEAEAAWESERASFADATSAQAWYLVILVRRGFAREALAIAQKSGAEGLVPRIRKAILCDFPGNASELVSAEDVAGDVLATFLRMPTIQEKVEHLRSLTDNGAKALPVEFWSRPNLDVVGGTTVSKNAEPNWYKKGQPLDTQFRDYLRLNVHGQYSYDYINGPLMATLVAWDEQHPGETKKVLERMWEVMKLSDWELRLDLFRNTLFERCQRVLSAQPQEFNRLFVQWVKRKLVDSPLQQQEGNMIYTLSLKDVTPFLYCLLGAQRLANISAKRCDQLLELGMTEYIASDDLVTWAAELYASDKGLVSLNWELPAKNYDRLVPWQIGIVEASKKQILNAVIAGAKASAATA